MAKLRLGRIQTSATAYMTLAWAKITEGPAIHDLRDIVGRSPFLA